mmetsp:Transcript_83898/g.242578  ORF Transcript_83898/g.242578 Transcript_83898/m.242578 type:complete len:330 (+) Transcript_83898:650-1639(+)
MAEAVGLDIEPHSGESLAARQLLDDSRRPAGGRRRRRHEGRCRGRAWWCARSCFCHRGWPGCLHRQPLIGKNAVRQAPPQSFVASVLPAQQIGRPRYRGLRRHAPHQVIRPGWAQHDLRGAGQEAPAIGAVYLDEEAAAAAFADDGVMLLLPWRSSIVPNGVDQEGPPLLRVRIDVDRGFLGELLRLHGLNVAVADISLPGCPRIIRYGIGGVACQAGVAPLRCPIVRMLSNGHGAVTSARRCARTRDMCRLARHVPTSLSRPSSKRLGKPALLAHRRRRVADLRRQAALLRGIRRRRRRPLRGDDPRWRLGRRHGRPCRALRRSCGQS